MTTAPILHENLATRRSFFRHFGLGIGSSAFAYLCNQDNLRASGQLTTHMPARAKSVIFFFMCGGVSHMDTFDPKDNRWAGKMVDTTNSNNGRPQSRPVLYCPRTFTRYGNSGTPVCEWFPHIGSVVDELAVIRSMRTHHIGHFQAAIQMATGHKRQVFDYPSLGSWISHSLGSVNENLPTFVNMGRPSSPLQASGGFFGAKEAATPFQANGMPLRNLQLPSGVSDLQRRRQMDSLAKLNEQFHQEFAFESEITARAKSYELAARLQMSAPEAVNFNDESQHVLNMYGIDEEVTNPFGRQTLLARRLVERGVRFIQICHGGRGNGDWDSHDSVADHAPLALQTDKPIAGLIKDLKQRGLLDTTLVVWASEFGRTPWSQNTIGRDHNPYGFSVWLAGGGIKGGIVHGATDDIGHKAIDSPHYVGDLQATILKQMGLDYEQMEVEINGAPHQVIEECDGPIEAILG
ncbi:MAG: DUF1501 domain-containing protein [Pirellulales bacterium]